MRCRREALQVDFCVLVVDYWPQYAVLPKLKLNKTYTSSCLVPAPCTGWWNHESAPFKFTQDYMEIMGGPGSDKWERYVVVVLTTAFLSFAPKHQV